jgi:hypothetical protein
MVAGQPPPRRAPPGAPRRATRARAARRLIPSHGRGSGRSHGQGGRRRLDEPPPAARPRAVALGLALAGAACVWRMPGALGGTRTRRAGSAQALRASLYSPRKPAFLSDLAQGRRRKGDGVSPALSVPCRRRRSRRLRDSAPALPRMRASTAIPARRSLGTTSRRAPRPSPRSCKVVGSGRVALCCFT